MQIELSFDRWKALTALLRDEDDSYDAVIGRLLESGSDLLRGGHAEKGQPPRPAEDPAAGAFFKDVFLPNGTELRATYKGKTHFAYISGSQWVDAESGQTRTSPSQAAYFITEKNVNGWLFWLMKRPGDHQWRSLNALRSK